MIVRPIGDPWPFPAGPASAAPTEVVAVARRRVVVDGPGGVELAGVRRRHVPHLRTLLAGVAERVAAAQTG